MTDLGLLSKQYKQLHDFLRRLREWITTIKQLHYELAQQVDVTKVTEAVNELSQIIQFMIEVIPEEDESEWDERWLLEPPLPIDVVEKIREKNFSQQSLYIEQLRRLIVRLEKKPIQLTDKDVDLLDEIMLAASADVSEVFRRMMRWA